MMVVFFGGEPWQNDLFLQWQLQFFFNFQLQYSLNKFQFRQGWL